MLTKKLPAPTEKCPAQKKIYRPRTRSIPKLLGIVFLITLFSSGCIKEHTNIHLFDKYLVSSTKIGDFTKEQLDDRYNDKTGLGYLAALDKYTISVYSIIYKTKYINDSVILASGCIIIPKNAPAPAMISMEHGGL